MHVLGFLDKFTLVGGLNLPKLIECYGSNGLKYKQLVKGRDDLRQDAVMQQVFGLVNNLLEENAETRKRRLNIRTYKVIPLSPAAGNCISSVISSLSSSSPPTLSPLNL